MWDKPNNILVRSSEAEEENPRLSTATPSLESSRRRDLSPEPEKSFFLTCALFCSFKGATFWKFQANPGVPDVTETTVVKSEVPSISPDLSTPPSNPPSPENHHEMLSWRRIPTQSHHAPPTSKLPSCQLRRPRGSRHVQRVPFLAGYSTRPIVVGVRLANRRKKPYKFRR